MIPIKYDNAGPFIEGLAAVYTGKKDKWGYINRLGNAVIPEIYCHAEPFFENMALVALHTAADSLRRDSLQKKYRNEVVIISDDKWGFIDKTGKAAIPREYDDARSFSEGLTAVYLDKRKQWGYSDKTGKEVIPVNYDLAGPFCEGLAVVKLYERWGYIDKTGKEVIPRKYDKAGPFSEGLAAVCFNSKWGYIDHAGKEVIPVKFDDHPDSTNPNVLLRKPGYGGIYIFSGGVALIKLKDRWVIINKNGNIINKS